MAISGAFGKKPEPGKRNDLVVFAEELRKGRKLADVADEYPAAYMRNGRGIKDWMVIVKIEKPRHQKTEVRLHVGPPGVGKSFHCNAEAVAIGGDNVYYFPGGEYWERYGGEPYIVMDDFYGNIRYHELLKQWDAYPHWVNVKNSNQNLAPKIIWVTSNKFPRDWYDKEKFRDLSAIYRRLTTCTVWETREIKRGLLNKDDGEHWATQYENDPIAINY